MSEMQPSRFSQAQLLIAALFALVFTGQTPETVYLGDPQLRREVKN